MSRFTYISEIPDKNHSDQHVTVITKRDAVAAIRWRTVAMVQRSVITFAHEQNLYVTVPRVTLFWGSGRPKSSGWRKRRGSRKQFGNSAHF